MIAEHSREYPHFPIPAVGAAIFQEDCLLLIRRGRPPAQGQWTLPGGVIEPGESPEHALIREVREECGLDIVVEELVELINKVIQDDTGQIRYHYLILDYLATCRHQPACRQTELQAGSDVTDARWVPLRELSSYDLTDGLIPVIEKAAALHGVGKTESQQREEKGELL